MVPFTIYDIVHGVINFPPYVQLVIDTVEFQRLRRIKQTGQGYLLYPSANHSRFEHCLGACHLAGQLLDALERNSQVRIAPEDRQCVLLAALLHDIGHGPYSHLWETFVHGYDPSWRHERTSVDLARRILSREQFDLPDRSITLIGELIMGKNSTTLASMLGRERMFLSEIVSGDIDVDRCDYLLRDSLYVQGIADVPRDLHTIFNRARIARDPTDGTTHISYHIGDLVPLYRFIVARQELHDKYYKHHVVYALDEMLLDVFKSAEMSGFLFKGKRLSTVHQCLDTFTQLDDNVVSLIELSEDNKLAMAKALLLRIHNRQLYRCVHIATCNLQEQVNQWNSEHADAQVLQLSRTIDASVAVFPSNIPLHEDGGAAVHFTDERRQIPPPGCQATDAINEYAIYCRATEPIAIRSAKAHFQQCYDN